MQFAKVGGLAPYNIIHAGIDFRKGQRNGIDIAAGMAAQFLFNMLAKGTRSFSQCGITLSGNRIQAFTHSFGQQAGPSRRLAHFAGFHGAFTRNGPVKLRKNGGQIRIGLQKLPERSIALFKSSHQLCTSGRRLFAKYFADFFQYIHTISPGPSPILL